MTKLIRKVFINITEPNSHRKVVIKNSNSPIHKIDLDEFISNDIKNKITN